MRSSLAALRSSALLGTLMRYSPNTNTTVLREHVRKACLKRSISSKLCLVTCNSIFKLCTEDFNIYQVGVTAQSCDKRTPSPVKNEFVYPHDIACSICDF